MAQESAKINKNLLKHLRSQKSETQTITANACFISERQYQNIEKDGCTTSRVAMSIAKHFNISPEELMTNISEDNSLWYITHSDFRFDNVEYGYDKAIQDIKSLAKSVANRFEPRLTIIDGTQVKEISITFHEEEFTWAIRPIELNEKIGLVWTELSDWQKDIWKIVREELIYGCVDEVYLDGLPLVPENVTPKFIVEFRECGQRKIINTGYRIFDSTAEFRVSLTQWLDALPMFIEPTHSELGIFNMIYGFTDEMTKALSIYKVWIDENGERMQAPWPVANIESLIKAMSDRKTGKRNWALPIAINESFDGQEVAPFEPEITYNKVTELPEINFILE